MARVFIDGQAGSTGLEIAERLCARSDIDLIHIDPQQRKDPQQRAQCLSRADISILCLPDHAARQAVALAGDDARLIDASSAHRTAPGWVYGFAELAAGQRDRIAAARRISNPGCYATGAIAGIAPLVRSGVIRPDQPVTIHAVSGYSGGGRALIEEFQSDTGPAHRLYALGLRHKHIPEIMHHSGLTRRPVFSPAVGNFRRGMIVCIPLHPAELDMSVSVMSEALCRAYQDEPLIRVCPPDASVTSLDPQSLSRSDRMDVYVVGDDDTAMVCAVLDNLGKGAAGAAIQNLNLALGVPEHTSLRETNQ